MELDAPYGLVSRVEVGGENRGEGLLSDPLSWKGFTPLSETETAQSRLARRKEDGRMKRGVKAKVGLFISKSQVVFLTKKTFLIFNAISKIILTLL